MKKSEARILVYLNNTDKRFHYPATMALKLDIGYNYLLVMIRSLLDKKYVTFTKRGVRKYYEISSSCPLNEAIRKLEPKLNKRDEVQENDTRK